jgi:serine phosphatase RsbU (regulator of sigma subunit)
LKAAQDQIIEKEKLERELQLARQIQESMLPKRLPRMREFDFGARMLPARAVGGDFFDFVLVDREHLGIVIGDVSDKGVPAALFMALVRSLLRSEAMRELSPKKVLGNINRCLLHMNAAGMFVTVLYGVLNRKKHEFCYARAGHEYPILLDEHGVEIEPDEGLGQLLGLLSEPEIYEQTITIPAKGTLLLYTDGVLDAIDDQGVLYGRERLQEILRSSLLTTAQGVCDQVLEAVMAYQSMNSQADDITLVAVRAR